MKNVKIEHHPLRGTFTVFLNKSADTRQAELYFKIEKQRIKVTNGLVQVTKRGIRVQRLGQGVFFEPGQILKIKVGWRKIWPINRLWSWIANLFISIDLQADFFVARRFHNNLIVLALIIPTCLILIAWFLACWVLVFITASLSFRLFCILSMLASPFALTWLLSCFESAGWHFSDTFEQMTD